MIKKITPFLVLGALLIIWSTYVLVTDGSGWGGVAAIAMLIFALVIVIVDFGLKKLLKKYKKVFLTETIVALVVIFIYNYTFNRKQTLVIPSDFDKNYVTLIYGVDNTNNLSISSITWNRNIKIPKNGILLTSSDFSEVLPKTEMKTESGIYLNSDETEKGFIRMSESEFESNGKNYQFRTWKIQEGFCCMYTSRESESYKAELKLEFEKLKVDK